MSLQQEHQAKAEAQTWRVQLERLAHSHRERLFHQASLLRSRLQSTERQLVSSEEKVQGLATANNKLIGMIGKAKEKAKTVQLRSERKHEEAKRELKQKLKSVENELQHLTEKIVSTGMMEGSPVNPSYHPNGLGKASKYRKVGAKQDALPKLRPILENKWSVLPNIATPIPAAAFPVYELSAPQYLPGSCPGPQFSYNSYPVVMVPRPIFNRKQSQFLPPGPSSQKKETYINHPGLSHTMASDQRPAQGGNNVSEKKSNSSEAFQRPPPYCSINTSSTPVINHFSAKPKVRLARLSSHTSVGESSIDRNPAMFSCDNESMGSGLTPCDKCHNVNKQRLVFQQREVYNEFARAHGLASHSNSVQTYAGSVTSPATTNTDRVSDKKLSEYCDNEPSNRREVESTASAIQLPNVTSPPYSVTTSDHQNTSTITEYTSSPGSEQRYFGDFERTASSLEVMKRRRIIHRRVSTENRTR